jgi:DNA-directed RNA polymerase specialized sigma24 family protein
LVSDLPETRPVLEAPFMIERESREAIDATPGQPQSGEPRRSQNKTKAAIDLYWLAFLVTGDREISIDIAADVEVSDPDATPFFVGWMRAWSRRLVIAKALAAIREELADSRRRIDEVHVREPLGLKGKCSPDLTKAGIEAALLAIDVFPRAALLLSLFEGMALNDVATLLDADLSLIKKARTAGLQELTTSLVKPINRAFPDFSLPPAFTPATS